MSLVISCSYHRRSSSGHDFGLRPASSATLYININFPAIFTRPDLFGFNTRRVPVFVIDMTVQCSLDISYVNPDFDSLSEIGTNII
ncbi:hypothetical protein NY2A_b330R [Paramecium bursaria Chlorella virus NY2A]|uniref:Uncharacterized protein b330R n=1 Tax=Paramecium bursaria Chlorella virus NY2A TaxID=46021 RepID=A7IWK5_PBCVN|nr:hypothetical protein NY2A_b330R [Paramecium bursaria Chlorella virus NY2A]ABT14729.1 hypothetical protein NY2A_b330R [Paramecium bursaria Chlorella virus NY2A]